MRLVILQAILKSFVVKLKTELVHYIVKCQMMRLVILQEILKSFVVKLKTELVHYIVNCFTPNSRYQSLSSLCL